MAVKPQGKYTYADYAATVRREFLVADSRGAVQNGGRS